MMSCQTMRALSSCATRINNELKVSEYERSHIKLFFSFKQLSTTRLLEIRRELNDSENFNMISEKKRSHLNHIIYKVNIVLNEELSTRQDIELF